MKAHSQRIHQRGSSLIIVLVFAVLLAGLAVAFLSRNELNVMGSRSSANGTRAEIFCQGAIATTIGDLRQEIVDGSTAVNGVYLPISAGGVRQNILPFPANKNCTVSTVVKMSLNGNPFYTSTAPFNYRESGPDRASNIPTDQASLNQRSVTLARWNKALLLPEQSYDSGFLPGDATNINFTTPDWIYVNRAGGNPGNTSSGPNFPLIPAVFGTSTGNGNVNDASANNQKYVVGRYSYVIYDESALLDMNAAGYPSPAGTYIGDLVNNKGSVGAADLTIPQNMNGAVNTGGIGLLASEVNQLVGLRNFATIQPGGTFPDFTISSADSYFNYLLGSVSVGAATATSGSTNIPPPFLNQQSANTVWEGARGSGFMHPVNQTAANGTDRMFGSRQELIHLLMDTMTPSTGAEGTRKATALQYLGTFSRTLNSPSWMPVTPAKSAVPYTSQALAQTANIDNVMPATVLVTKAFQRDDGTWAKVGDPLMKYRFPLRRLEWFNDDGKADANALTFAKGIQRWFGMKAAGDGTWNLVNPVTGAPLAPGLPTILTLPQVAAAGREPDFWEVLQAAILSGSVGDGNQWNFGSSGVKGAAYSSTDINPVRHILQIGLNIIDQYNTNPTPTVLRLGVPEATSITDPLNQTPIAGTKNLPYIWGMFQQGFPTTVAPPPADQTLPCPNKVNTAGINRAATGPVAGDLFKNTYVMYMMFMLWNPHVNTTVDYQGNLYPAQSFYLSAEGASQLRDGSNPPTTINSPLVAANAIESYSPFDPNHDSPSATYSAIPFTAAPDRFANIDLLIPSDATAQAKGFTYNSFPTGAGKGGHQIGVRLGTTTVQHYPLSNSNSPVLKAWQMMQVYQGPQCNATWQNYFGAQDVSCSFSVTGCRPMNYRLEVKDLRGNYVPYQVIPDDRDQPSSANWQPYYTVTSAFMLGHDGIDSPNQHAFASTLAFMHADPRTMRLGAVVSGGVVGSQTGEYPGAFNWNLMDSGGGTIPVTQANVQPTVFIPAPVGDTPGPAVPFQFADLAYNTKTSGMMYYPSTNIAGPNAPDKIVRRADGNKPYSASQSKPLGSPYYNAANGTPTLSSPALSPARPYFLGRPFKSVAEMGYAFRDEPWEIA